MTVNMLLVNFSSCFFFNIIGLNHSTNIIYLHEVTHVMGVSRNFHFPLATPLIEDFSM